MMLLCFNPLYIDVVTTTACFFDVSEMLNPIESFCLFILTHKHSP